MHRIECTDLNCTIILRVALIKVDSIMAPGSSGACYRRAATMRTTGIDSSNLHRGAPPAHEHDVRRQLARITGSALFRASLRLRAFLTFVVEVTLSGQAHRIKAYTIAIEALGRGDDFDPQTDAIVRVEAGRLRQALSRYYAGTGRDDPLVIAIPRGGYVPVFH